jgi:hypothetical protein
VSERLSVSGPQPEALVLWVHPDMLLISADRRRFISRTFQLSRNRAISP